MMFAELDVTTKGVLITALVFITVAGLAHGANEILRFLDRFKEKPPMDEQLRRHEERLMARLTQQDVAAEYRVNTLSAEIKKDISTLEDDVRRAHERMDAQGHSIAFMQGQMAERKARL